MTLDEIRNTDLEDFDILRESYEMDMLNKRFLASYSAFQTAKAQGTDSKGRPVYKKFADLFNYEKELNMIKNPPKKNEEEERRKEKLRILIANANK